MRKKHELYKYYAGQCPVSSAYLKCTKFSSSDVTGGGEENPTQSDPSDVASLYYWTMKNVLSSV
jgi:hypothetical protein